MGCLLLNVFAFSRFKRSAHPPSANMALRMEQVFVSSNPRIAPRPTLICRRIAATWNYVIKRKHLLLRLPY